MVEEVLTPQFFACHRISHPPTEDRIVAVETFEWLGRETVAMATRQSVWLCWRREAKSGSKYMGMKAELLAYRQLIDLSVAGMATGITSLSVLPGFGRLLLVFSGQLLSFNLKEMIPNNLPEMWIAKKRSDALELSRMEEGPVCLLRIGKVKQRMLSE